MAREMGGSHSRFTLNSQMDGITLLCKKKQKLSKPVHLSFCFEAGIQIPEEHIASLHFSQGYITQTPPHVSGSDTTLQGGAVNSIKPTPQRPEQLKKNREKAVGKSRRERVSLAERGNTIISVERCP